MNEEHPLIGVFDSLTTRLTNLELNIEKIVSCEKRRQRTKYGDICGDVFGFPFSIWRRNGRIKGFVDRPETSSLARSCMCVSLYLTDERDDFESIFPTNVIPRSEIGKGEYGRILHEMKFNPEDIINKCDDLFREDMLKANYKDDLSYVSFDDIGMPSENVGQDLNEFFQQKQIDDLIAKEEEWKKARLHGTRLYLIRKTDGYIDDFISIFLKICKRLGAEKFQRIEICDSDENIPEINRLLWNWENQKLADGDRQAILREYESLRDGIPHYQYDLESYSDIDEMRYLRRKANTD